MGLAWLSATALIALIGWRGRHVSRGLALFVALFPAWLFMFVSLQSVEDGLQILRLRLRGFEVVNREGPDFRLADRTTEIDQDVPAIALDRVSGFDRPVDVSVERLIVRTASTGREQTAFSVALSYPKDLDVFVGLEDPDHPFPYDHIYELTDGDKIDVCPKGDRCPSRRIDIKQVRGRWFVGPCALSGWFGGEMRDSTRTLSLLDLYHYAPDRCSPQRVTRSTALWVQDLGGEESDRDDVQSFFIYKEGRLFFAWVDPRSLVDVSFDDRQSEAVTRKVSTDSALRIKMMWKERRFLKDRIYDDPSIDEPLCGYADTPDEADYSGRRLCKRIRVYLPETELRVALTDNVRITLPPADAPAVSLSCSVPPRTLDPLSATRERCDETPLAAAYAANTRFRPLGVPTISFPVSLVAGEPISEVLRIERGSDCGRLAPPCLVAKGRAKERAYPIGQVAAIGSGASEHHLIDTTFFG
ncbi:MAG: hypothetical protein AAF449_11630, partial [Myxococcota bacterium]